MALFTIDPNMGFPNPTPGQDPGPDYANNLQTSLTVVGAHDHSPGKGVLITPNGLNINSDLSMASNNLTFVNTINYIDLPSSLPGSAPNLGCTYVAGGELYYNDEAGNVVQMTDSGSVNAGAGSITGLPSGTASASFSGGTFIWQSATSTAAGMDGGPVTIREILSGANGITIASPASLGSNYTISLPTALPAGQRFLTLDNSGNMAASWNVDNSSIEVSSNLVQVKALGIVNSMIANQTIQVGKLAVKATGTTVSAGGLAVSTSSGVVVFSSGSPILVNNQDITITTTGRPVYMQLMSDGSGGTCYIGADGSPGNELNVTFFFYRDGVEIARSSIVGDASASNGVLRIPASTFSFLDDVVAGTYNYQLFASKTSGSNVTAENIVMKVYET